MAVSKIKATYSLDAETVGALERLARRWGVSTSEALCRAIHASAAAATAAAAPDAEPSPRLAAFRRLQAMMHLDTAKADAWVAELCAERDASSAGHRYWPEKQ